MITAKLTKRNAIKLIGTRCAMKLNPRSFLGYKKIIDTEEYAVFEHPVKRSFVVAAMAILCGKAEEEHIVLHSKCRAPFLNYRIELCDRNFPSFD